MADIDFFALDPRNYINANYSFLVVDEAGVPHRFTGQMPTITAGGYYGFGFGNPQARLDASLALATASAAMNAGAVNDVAILRAPFAAGTASNSGAKWGLRFHGATDGTVTRNKTAAVYAVSEDPSGPYNRRVGLAFHVCDFDTVDFEAVRIDCKGNVGIGTATPGSKFHLNTNTSQTIFAAVGNPAGQTRVGVHADGTSMITVYSGAPALGFYADNLAGGFTEFARFTNAGTLLVGTPVGAQHTIARGTTQGDYLLNVSGLVNACASFYSAGGGSPSAAAAALRLTANTATNRSINAGGTVNASGSDYAEYMRKAVAWIDHTFLKGELVGINADAELTPRWSESHTCMFKTYDPSILGGDKWAEHLGPEPEAPAPIAPAPIAPVQPEPFDAPEPVREEGEEDGAYTLRIAQWLIASAAYAEALAHYTTAVVGYPALFDAWTHAKAAFDAAQAEFETNHPIWKAAYTEAQAAVDRVAFCGQVPVIVTGPCAVGQYLIAEEGPDDTIICRAYDKAALIADRMAGGDMEYRKVGKVWAIREVRRDPRPDSEDTTMVTRAWANVLHS